MTKNKTNLKTGISLSNEINYEEEVNTENQRKYVTVKQLINLPQYEGLFTESSIRFHIFNEKLNGFNRCIIRINRKIIIDTNEFENWIQSHKQGGSK